MELPAGCSALDRSVPRATTATRKDTISESPLNLEYVSSAQRPSQYQAAMRYVSETFSVVRSKSVNKVRQLQCTRHLHFPPEYKTAKTIIR